MKTTIDGFDGPVIERSLSARRDWTAASIGKVVAGIVLLSLVCMLASWIPADSSPETSDMVLRFVVFWVCGGIFTVALLVFSDRTS